MEDEDLSEGRLGGVAVPVPLFKVEEDLLTEETWSEESLEL